MKKSIQRNEKIIDILSESRFQAIRDLASALDVSEITIRRDLNKLELEGRINLINGVAILNPNLNNLGNTIYEVSSECDKHTNEKILIGKKAMELIDENDVVIIDTGTTTYQLAKHLPDIPITIISYNMNILSLIYIKKNYTIICPGGYYHSNIQMFESQEGIDLINRTCAKKAFMSAAGISCKLDVTCIEQNEIMTKKKVLEVAENKILLADSSKFSKICPARFASLTDFNTIITDRELEKEWVSLIKELKIELILV